MLFFPLMRQQYCIFLYCSPFSYRSSNFAIAKVIALNLFASIFVGVLQIGSWLVFCNASHIFIALPLCLIYLQPFLYCLWLLFCANYSCYPLKMIFFTKTINMSFSKNSDANPFLSKKTKRPHLSLPFFGGRFDSLKKNY